MKKGEVKAHHFSHKSNSVCTDHWHYDMSDWHLHWQELFPLKTQEIVLTKDGHTHRADVLLEDEKVVYEFQHSAITDDEFKDRNNFYNSLGYKVIWIFDMIEQFENGIISGLNNNWYEWPRPKNTFKGFIPKNNPDIELFFQTHDSAERNEDLKNLEKLIESGHPNVTWEDKRYYQTHKNDVVKLLKVIRVSQRGFTKFATDGSTYFEKDMVKSLFDSGKEACRPIHLCELVDHLKEMYSKEHTTYYFGCPRSSTHLCGSSNIDIPIEKYYEIYPCTECHFVSYDSDNHPLCSKRFIDLKIPMDTEVEITKRNEDGFISQISFLNQGNKCLIELPTYKNNLGKSLFSLWADGDYAVAIFKNLKNGIFIKLTRSPIQQRSNFGQVKGYASWEQYSFKGEWKIISGCEKPEWVCVWSAKKR